VSIDEVRSQGIRIVFDHPAGHIGRRLWRAISTAAGAVLVSVGLTASIPAVPATLAVVSLVIGWVATDPDDPDPWPPPDAPVREVVLVWALTTPLAVVGIKHGLRLLRRHRMLVLFLRRFGHDEAQSAVTFAVVQMIGASWRVVTLDDAEMAPLGVADGTRRALRVGHFASKHLVAIGTFAGLRMFPMLVLAGWAVVALAVAGPALDFALTGVTSPEPWMKAIDPLVEILGSIFDGRLPFDAISPSLPGLFALVAIAAAISFGVMMATMVALILALPLSTVLFFLSSSAQAIREAEQSKSIAVRSLAEIRSAAQAIAVRSRKVFGPRLVVVRSAGHVWQDAVRELAALAAVQLIDISDPTENVLWEIDELQRRGHTIVLIGHAERVAPLAAGSAEAARTSIQRRLAQLLDGREVLAYTTDRRGLERFARALRGMLLDIG
jgi:hypothetical protein